jgi:hypothetical protein
MPNDLSPANREIWELLWTLRAADQGANGRAVSLLEESRVRQFVPVRTVPGRIGHTYLLRSIVAGEHDVLAAFSTVDRDEHGDWILWQRIQERDLKSAPKRK